MIRTKTSSSLGVCFWLGAELLCESLQGSRQHGSYQTLPFLNPMGGNPGRANVPFRRMKQQAMEKTIIKNKLLEKGVS